MTDARTIPIVMADDDPDDRLFAEDAFRQGGMLNELFFVEDGVELMAFLRGKGRYADAPRPGLILLDLNMPKKDGKEALEEIKTDPDLKRIPVVILTTSKEEEDILDAYNLGCNSYLRKPLNFGAFVTLVQTLESYWFQIVHLPPK